MTHAEHLTEVTTLDTFYENSMENDELHRKKYPIENIYKIHYCATRLWYTKPDLYYGRQINKSSLVSSIIAKCDKNTTPVCNRIGATACDTEDLYLTIEYRKVHINNLYWLFSVTYTTALSANVF